MVLNFTSRPRMFTPLLLYVPSIHDDICMASDALAILFRSKKGCTICPQQTNGIRLEYTTAPVEQTAVVPYILPLQQALLN